MKKILFVGIFFLLIVGQVFTQTRIHVSSGKTQLEITENNRDGFFVKNSIEYFDIQLENMFTNGEYVELNIDGYGSSFDIGNPDLQVLNRLIEVPFGASVEVNIISFDEVVFNLSDYNIHKQLFPAQESVFKSDDPTKIMLKKNSTVYEADQWFFNPLARYHDEGIMRGVRFGRLEISPFAYNPVSGELKLFNNLKVEVKFLKSDFTKTEKVKKQYYTPAFNGLLSGLLNYNPVHIREDQTLSSVPMHFVIISDRMFEETLAPFIAWKKKQGFLVTVRYTDEEEVGTTTTSIKNYLQELYINASPSAPAPAFVALVGDVAQIPAFLGTAPNYSAHPTDLYYTTYDGESDIIPDLFIGRLSAQTVAQLEAILYKTLKYEQFQMADPSYLKRSLTIAGYDTGFAPLYGNGALNYMAHYLNTAHGIEPFAMFHPCNGQGATVISKLNQGMGIASYSAHGNWSCWGDPNVTVSDINALTNTEKWGLLIGNCCLTAKFDENECFGEAVIRAANKGGIGYIGASNNTTWSEDYWWTTGCGTIVVNPQIADFGVGSFDALFHENGELPEQRAITGSQMNVAGLLAVNESSSSYKEYYWEIYHFFGDPTLMPFIGPMPPMNPTYLTEIHLGIDTLTIKDLAPGSYVALTDHGELKAAGFADNAGFIELEFEPFTMTTTADLVATTTFYRPYFKTIEIAPPQDPYVVYQSHTTTHEDMLTYISNHSEIEVTLKNVGLTPTSGTLTVEISCEDPLLTINNATAKITSVMNAGGTAIATFKVTVDHTIPNNKSFLVNIKVTGDGKAVWNSKMNLKAYAPVLTLNKILINNMEDGKLYAGSVNTLTAVVKNKGGAGAYKVKGNIEMDSEYITLACEEFLPAGQTLPAGETMKLTFNVITTPEIPYGHEAAIKLLLDAQYGISATTEFNVSSSGNSNYCTNGTQNCFLGDNFTSVILYKTSDPSNLLINNQSTSCLEDGYQDFTNVIIPLEPGKSYTIKVKVNSENNQIGGWFDLNGNNSFDPHEKLITLSCGAAGSENKTTFTVPNNNLTSGTYRFRLVTKYFGTPLECNNQSYGQTHDYTIELQETYPRVQNVEATLHDNNIIVVWDKPQEISPDSYNIYRNGNKLNNTPLTETTFMETNIKSDVYVYNVTAVYNNIESLAQMSNVICNIHVGVESPKLSFNLFPNPTTGEFIINNEQLTINSVEIFDIYGKKLSSHHLISSSSNHLINIAHLSAGVYFVKIYTKTGAAVMKIVKM